MDDRTGDDGNAGAFMGVALEEGNEDRALSLDRALSSKSGGGSGGRMRPLDGDDAVGEATGEGDGGGSVGGRGVTWSGIDRESLTPPPHAQQASFAVRRVLGLAACRSRVDAWAQCASHQSSRA